METDSSWSPEGIKKNKNVLYIDLILHLVFYLFLMQDENSFDLIQEIEMEMKKRQSNTQHIEETPDLNAS